MIKHMLFIQEVYFHRSDVFILPKISYQYHFIYTHIYIYIYIYIYILCIATVNVCNNVIIDWIDQPNKVLLNNIGIQINSITGTNKCKQNAAVCANLLYIFQ